MENNLLSLIIFAPLAGAAINWFAGRRVRNERFIALVACGSVAVSTIVAFRNPITTRFSHAREN